MPEWPADKVERRAVSALIPYARNARTHSEAQVAQIAASIREWGFTNPVLLDENSGIIAGHGRVMAAKLLGFADIPVMVAEGWSEAQKRAYVIADNKLALNAGWDGDALSAEIGDIVGGGFDMLLAGFTEGELDQMLSFAGPAISEVKTTVVDDKFWISVRGPLARQAEVLDALKSANLDGIDIDVGAISLSP